jgi:hypothetical protein
MLKSKKSQINSLSKLNIKELQKNEINIIIISIIYNIFVLSYILNLEKQDCHCFRDWRHDFMKYYSIALILWGVLTIGFTIYNVNNEFINVIRQISVFAYLVNVWCLYSYIGILDYTNCNCAIITSKKTHYFLYLFRYIVVGLLFTSLLFTLLLLFKK